MNRIYICSSDTPPAFCWSEVNLQLIRKWGYTDRKVKIKPYPPQPLLQIHLCFLRWLSLSSLHLLFLLCPCCCFLSRWPSFVRAQGIKGLCLGFWQKSTQNIYDIKKAQLNCPGTFHLLFAWSAFAQQQETMARNETFIIIIFFRLFTFKYNTS